MRRLCIISKKENEPVDVRTSTIIDKYILEHIKSAMDFSGYGQRQRSLWINEAINQFAVAFKICDVDEKAETLSRATTLSDNGSHITVVLKPEAVAFIDECKSFMAPIDPSFDVNAQSRLIHFAITFRLIQEKRL
jgi:hypothetical protein